MKSISREKQIDEVIRSIEESTKRIEEPGKKGENLQLEFQKTSHIRDNGKAIIEAVKVEAIVGRLELDIERFSNVAKRNKS